MDKDYIITKSNKLIACNYDLSLQEQKIILTLASMVQPQDTEFKEYEFKIKDFIKLLGLKDQSKYKEVPKITKDLMKKVFEIKEGKDTIQLAWLSSARYRNGEGTIVLKFDSNLKPYMLELKELYTSYKIHNVLSLKSKYSIRLYEILKSNLFKKQVIIELEELKNMVGANEKAYSIYNNVKNRIIIQAQKELNEKTDIDFEFEEVKTGRKITSLKFYIKANKKAVDEICATNEDDSTFKEEKLPTGLITAVKGIFKEGITSLQAKTLLNTAKGDISIIKEKYKIAEIQGGVTGIVGWMIDAIKKDYPAPKGKIKDDTFNGYEQRNYNFDTLEKMATGQVNYEESREDLYKK